MMLMWCVWGGNGDGLGPLSLCGCCTGSSSSSPVCRWIMAPLLVGALAYWLYDAINISLEGIDLVGKRVVVCGASMGIGR